MPTRIGSSHPVSNHFQARYVGNLNLSISNLDQPGIFEVRKVVIDGLACQAHHFSQQFLADLDDMPVCGLDMIVEGQQPGGNSLARAQRNDLGGHPAVAMVAVIGVPDERMGEVGKAFVVVRSGTTLDEAELISWSRANMANYKVPRRVALIDELPRNAAGKVAKLELR